MHKVPWPHELDFDDEIAVTHATRASISVCRPTWSPWRLLTSARTPRLTTIKNEFAERHRKCGHRPSVPSGDTCNPYRRLVTYMEIK